MKNNTHKQASVISFLSGKGGSGKTSSSLAISKILSDVGFKILLIDFDFATSGATYFFLPNLNDTNRNGLIDFINKQSQDDIETDNSNFTIQDLIISTIGNFDFIPSRTDMTKHIRVSMEVNDKDFYLTHILGQLNGEIKNSYDFILLDNQAGYSESSAAAAKFADKAIIVSESDRISSDAVDNLIALIGSDMPKFRRYLINKVEIKEAGDYKNKIATYKEINRLPPLPFDFEVRNAFGERRIPVDLEKPSSFLIALFTTVKEILPEETDILVKYEEEKVTKLFDEYQYKLDLLIKRRDEINEKIIEFETLEKRIESDNKIQSTRIFAYFTSLVTVLGFMVTILFFFGIKIDSKVLSSAFGMFITMAVAGVTYFLKLRSVKLKETAKLEESRTKDNLRFQREMVQIESEVQRYNNLMATRSSELLVDFETKRTI